MLDYPHLSALAAVVRTGSFDAAAHALGLTPSAVSQRLKALEDRAGTTLVIRDQPCRATAAGARMIQHVEEVQLLEHALARDLGAAPGPTRLRLAVNADSLATWVLPALAQTDGLLFDLVIDDQDHSADWLKTGEVAAAITSRAAPVQGCDSHPLGALAYVATASPAFAARWFPDGPTAAALRAAPALTFNQKDRLQADWAAAHLGQKLVLPTHYLPSSHAFVEAVELGLGWGMNPEPLAREALAAGRLIALSETPFLTELHWQVRRVLGAPLRPVTAALRRMAKAQLAPPGVRAAAP